MSNPSVDRSRVEALFLEALEREGADRDALLKAECGDDGALLAEVRSLLDSLEAPGLIPALEEERPFGGRFPDRVANYRIVRPLGEGGMGIVLLAIREGPGFEQTVALKLIRGRFVDPLLARRLEEERRILALLEHPGIARLVDGGITEDGQPYYAMEYVRGEDLLTFCDSRRMGIEDRLRLFIRACEGVHHAHQQLVVHRDLKPSNILVTPEGRPKLLDFGIAKTLEALASGEATSHWVTPSYASPEQLCGGVVGTRSDVYALGVILCELLTGLKPYRLPSGPPAAVANALVTQAPVRPSELVSDPGASRETDGAGTQDPDEAWVRRADARRTSPARLARSLQDELDLVVLKALAREPDRRYDSAAALADDLVRHLDHRPIQARPDTLRYRTAKFLGRNRPLTATVTLLVLALASGAAGVLWQARRAATERDRATLEAARAQQVTGIMTDIFRLGDPTRAVGDTIGVRQILEEGVRRVETSLTEDPALQATLFLELARIHRNLGLLAEAERLGERALELRVAHAPGSLGHADVLGFLGLLQRDAGHPMAAIVRLEEAVELRDRVSTSPDTALATLLAGLGWEVRAAGDSDRAADLFSRALEIQQTQLGSDAPVVGTTMLGLAATFHDQGSFDEAETLFRTALAPGRSEPSPVVATALVNLGMMQRIREQFVEAEEYLRAGLDMRTRLYDPDHPDVVEARQEVAVDLSTLGRYAEAEPLLRQNLETGLRILEEDHEAVRGAHEALGTLYHDLGRWDDAITHLEAALASKRRVRGPEHPAVVYSLVALGDVLVDADRLNEAEGRYEEALAMGARLGGNEGVYGALSRHGLTRVALARGELARADSLLAAARHLLAGLREDHRYRLDLRRTEARLAFARGRPAEAEAG
ncbi:MAG: serine/threonine-protein kinase [Gemmatimonadota bacterium]